MIEKLILPILLILIVLWIFNRNLICKYRILEHVYDNGDKNYKVQINPLFGFPFLWFTATFCSLNPPHPDLSVPAFCELNCIFSTLEDAKKCLIGLSSKNSKIIYKKVIK